MAKLLMVDGTIKNIIPNKGEGQDFSLEELQSLVGGHIESVDLKWLKRTGQINPDIVGDYIIVNEEGKIKGLPINILATALVNGRDIIVGHAILCSDKEFV